MVRKKGDDGFTLTRQEGVDLFCLLSHAQYKLQGKHKSVCQKFFQRFERALGLNPEEKTKD